MMKSSHLAEKIAQDISQKIASREIAVGEKLRAQALADRYGVSRSPIREALKLLDDAGLVEQKTNRGFLSLTSRTATLLRCPKRC